MTKYIGAHVSASGGVGNAILNAEAIGANAFALFTRNQRSWVSKPLPQLEIDGFRALLVDRGFKPEMVLPHDSYLINLGSPDEETLQKSRAAFLDDPAFLDAKLDGVRTAVVVTCLGGGTSNGATAELLKRLRSLGIASLVFATLPFSLFFNIPHSPPGRGVFV